MTGGLRIWEEEGIEIRRAWPSDQEAIQDMVHEMRLNPLGLHWERFLVASGSDGQLFGLGQIKTHRDGSNELASIAVVPRFRGQGLARALIEALLRDRPPAVYLTCRSLLIPFYQRFGFRTASGQDLTPYFRRLRRLASLLSPLLPRAGGMTIMRRG
ncbi:MAG: GNAT family N-acetyltransferase [Anaerolineales bacterium]|jgi:N-acetylglutamate synthase-like GNAT family acetyltransferase